jgi:hypothetical protein
MDTPVTRCSRSRLQCIASYRRGEIDLGALLEDLKVCEETCQAPADWKNAFSVLCADLAEMHEQLTADEPVMRPSAARIDRRVQGVEALLQRVAVSV